MEQSWINHISPYVRAARIQKSTSLAGEWMDPDHVYTYIDQGEAEFFLNGVKYLVKEGDVLLMHPFMPHIIKSSSALPLVQCILHFDLYYDEQRHAGRPDAMKHREEEMELASIAPVTRLPLADRMDMKKKFLMLQKELSDPSPASPLLLKSICLELLYTFMKSRSLPGETEGKLTKGWPLLEGAIHYIHEHYHDSQLSNESIGKHAGVTANHLSYLFKSQLGITIHNYLKHVRIEQAKLRILQGRQNLTEIAEETGFSSIHLFSRIFKNTVGVMPSKYAAAQSALNKQDLLSRPM
ncbi:AraC family transcriptional regulator [Paenibacillus agri]|uniref:Helix-turn-helix transcriptional regulator n=1 Tax=Paenibacillus agri TaxID=2744309 RepID=A0A850ED63_9BACL|nr:AraC family transcriptional regulator [Paenibacillus agri]NUU59145.1 helix-turn-helix transcriptional regulator [Paenibacillus agri]